MKIMVLGSTRDIIVRMVHIVVLFYGQEVFGRGFQLPI